MLSGTAVASSGAADAEFGKIENNRHPATKIGRRANAVLIFIISVIFLTLY
jgi:hypothetical protein